MDEINEKKKIAAAMNEPRAPEGLVENMVQRATAIERGRSAMQQLKDAGPELSEKNKLLLGAAALIGRIATGNWPENSRADDLTKQLYENSVFRKAADLPAATLAEKISDGSFLKSFQQAHEQTKSKEKQTPSLKDPEKSIPVI